jgi:hypothetical protein
VATHKPQPAARKTMNGYLRPFGPGLAYAILVVIFLAVVAVIWPLFSLGRPLARHDTRLPTKSATSSSTRTAGSARPAQPGTSGRSGSAMRSQSRA